MFHTINKPTVLGSSLSVLCNCLEVSAIPVVCEAGEGSVPEKWVVDMRSGRVFVAGKVGLLLPLILLLLLEPNTSRFGKRQGRVKSRFIRDCLPGTLGLRLNTCSIVVETNKTVSVLLLLLESRIDHPCGRFNGHGRLVPYSRNRVSAMNRFP
jgi:hypothetical protein